MTNKIKYYVFLFLLGFYGYGFLEIIWRQYTHPSMGIAGALSLIFISLITEHLQRLNIIYKAILSALFITFIEFTIGYIVNIKLNAAVWDYSLVPFNYKGQICLLFSCLWFFISIPFIKLSEKLSLFFKN